MVKGSGVPGFRTSRARDTYMAFYTTDAFYQPCTICLSLVIQ